MELQRAEGKILLTFIRSKCFVKFFVCVFLSPTLLFFFFFFFFFYVSASSGPLLFFVFFLLTATGWTSAAFSPNHSVALQISSESSGCEWVFVMLGRSAH